MGKIYSALGLMSGTSMDGVDASIIQSDGETNYKVIYDKFFEYNPDLYRNLTNLRDKITNLKDMQIMSKEIKSLEKEITIFHAQISNQIIEKSNVEIDFIGFHGQTIFHNIDEKITKQLGDGNLLSQLTKKKVIYNFRQNDLKNGGDGAPLAPIFHNLLVKVLVEEKKIKTPVTILNIGGIANITSIDNNYEMFSLDIGPGNCLIDKWIRINSNKNFDDKGNIAKSGKVDKFILEQTLDKYYNNNISKKRSLDINDFDISFARGLSLENGAATITAFTADILSQKLMNNDIYVCGGGRNNNFLIETIQKKISEKIKRIDVLGLDGNFIESQAFGYLAIRSYLGFPISFPKTTGCSKPSLGGEIVKNF
ncbi:anhydro-N-acetylmuramic acid kinase [Candidatus Pelagibacter sp.]|nr:anhydro-N-acetylmuramic acid kinase [Candidatus Pelagibacter sp.]